MSFFDYRFFLKVRVYFLLEGLSDDLVVGLEFLLGKFLFSFLV